MYILGYNSLLGPNRRYSYSFGRNKSGSVESSRIFSAYPMGGSFGIDDYFIESDDGEEADDEFDQITNSADVEEKVNQYQLCVPTRVSQLSPKKISNAIYKIFHCRETNHDDLAILPVVAVKVRTWNVAARL